MHADQLSYAHSLKKDIDDLAFKIKTYSQNPHLFRVAFVNNDLNAEMRRIAVHAVIAAQVERLANKVWQITLMGIDLAPKPPKEDNDDESES